MILLRARYKYNHILIISLYVKVNKCIVSSVLNSENNTNWQLGSMSGWEKISFLTLTWSILQFVESCSAEETSDIPVCSKLVNVQSCSTSAIVDK